MESNVVTEKTIQGLLEKVYSDLRLLPNTSPRTEAENIVKFLFQAMPFNHNYFSKRLYQTLFLKKNSEFLADILNELQLVSQILLKILQQSSDEIQKELCEFVLGQVLAFYPFLEPLPAVLNIPQKINGRWLSIQYSTEKLELTPRWLGSPLTAYGLTSNEGHSLLLFMGTPQPTASGSFLSVWTDLVPGFMVGELAFRLFAKKKIKSWLDKQVVVKIYGLSLGGSLAQLTACYLPDTITEVHAYGPPGLFSRAMKVFNGKPKVAIYWQKGDLIPLLGSGFHPDFQLYKVSCLEKQDLFFGHVRAIPVLSYVKVEVLPPASNKRRCARLVFNASHIAFSILMFPILTLVLAFRVFLGFIKRGFG
jgi:hypothetical protein